MLSLLEYYKSFKSYDIRWIWGKEIDADLWYYLGRWLGEYILEQTGTQATIMIGADTRENNTQLINNTLLGLKESQLSNFISAGMNFENYPHGICSTAMAYSFWYNTCDYSIIFSASHNTSEYIGIKIVTRENKFIPTSKLKELFTKAYEACSSQWFTSPNNIQALSRYKDNAILNDSKKKLSDLLDRYFGQVTKNHSFAIDYGHGAAVAYEQDYIKKLQTYNLALNTYNLFTTPDGLFPAHETDTSRFANYKQLTEEVQSKWLDFWFMFDGDADRLWIVLKNGTVITGDILTAIVAKQLLTNGISDKFWSKKVFYEVFSSKVVKETTEKYKGTSTMVRVWRGAFCEQFINEKWLVAGEVSAHILFWPFGYCEIPLLALALILKESEEFESFDAMASHYMYTHKSQVYHFAISDKDGLMKHIDESYPELAKNYVDGVRMDGNGFRFTIRKSWTEDIVKVAGEADNTELFEKERNKLRTIIIGFGGHEE